MSWYSFSTSTSSVGFTGTPLRARQRPPAFWAFLSVERMRVGWSGSMARRALPSSMSRAQVQSRAVWERWFLRPYGSKRPEVERPTTSLLTETRLLARRLSS